jgi:hypothetical protein
MKKFGKILTHLLLITSMLIFVSSCSDDIAGPITTDQSFETGNQISLTEGKTDQVDQDILTDSLDITESVRRQNKTAGTNFKSSTIIYEEEISLSKNKVKYLYGYVTNLPDPYNQKLSISVDPISGDPDLYLYGYRTDTRLIRKSTESGSVIDELTFRQTDFTLDEEKFLIRLKAYKATQFLVTIKIVNVDCQEYAPTPRNYPAIAYAPVCGCNNKDYDTYVDAMVSGLTSWTDGKCNSTRYCSEEDLEKTIYRLIYEEMFCDRYKGQIYKAKYKGEWVVYVNGELDPNLIDAPTDFIFNCEGEVIASNGFVTPEYELDYDEIYKIELIKSCYPSYCPDSHRALTLLKEQNAYLCEKGCALKIYKIKYNHRPAYYVSLECSNILDVGGTIYDCDLNILACDSYGCENPILLDQIEIEELYWECKPTTTCNDLYEGFENYNHYEKISEQSHKWETWSNKPGSYEDGDVYISERSGNKMLYMHRDGIQDVVYKLGNLKKGKYKLSFSIWNTKVGYFNLQASESERVSGGVFGVYFGSQGNGEIKTNSNRKINFRFKNGEWTKIKIVIDFDNNDHTLHIGNNSWKLNSVSGLMLGGVNYYAVDNAQFYVDDIKLKCLK